MSAYALTVEPGTPLGRAVAAGSGRRPTTTTRPTSTRSPTTASAPPASSGTRSRTGPGRARSAATTSSTGTRATTPAIGCAAHGHTEEPTGGPGAGGTCARPSATSPRWRPESTTEAGDERLDPAVREAERLTLMLRTRGGIKLSRPNADFSPMDACIDDLARRRVAGNRRRPRRPHVPRSTARERVVARLLVALDAAGRPARWHSVESSANGPRRT